MRQHILGVAMAAAMAATGHAQTYLSETIKLVLAFPPGGSSTFSSLPVTCHMEQMLGQKVELEYRPGAGGNVTAVAVARAKADGHTLFYGHAGLLSINHYINPQSFFDARKDFAPITLPVGFPLVLAVQPGMPAASVAAFAAHAKEKGADLVFGSAGNGSVQHLGGELFKRVVGADFLHVPYAGGGRLQKAFLAGDIQIMFDTGSNIMPHVPTGKMKPLAVMASSRLPVVPEVPTMTESGYPGLAAKAWFGFLAPAATPQAIVARLDQVIREALARADVRKELTDLGARVIAAGPDGFAQVIATEDIRWREVVRAVGVKPD